MIKQLIVFLALFLALGACGDNKVIPDGGVQRPPDSGSGPDAPPPAPTAVVVSGDFTPGHPGIMATINTDVLSVRTGAAPAGSVGDDPVLRRIGGELFVVNRAENNVTILDATTRTLVEQLGTGAGSNPQDVAVHGNKLYVPVYGGSGVAVLTRGSMTQATIDLGSYDPDGMPNCSSAYAVGDRVFVACQLLDETFSPRGPGLVAVIDTATDQVKSTVTMQTKNPLALFEQLPTGDLAIGTIDFSDNSGCVEKITTGATPGSGGCIVTNAALGGYANRYDTHGMELYVAVASATDFTKSDLWAYDMAASTLGTSPMSASTEKIIDVAACPDGTVVASDGTAASGGVRVYRAGSEVTTSGLVVGLTPAAQHGLACY